MNASVAFPAVQPKAAWPGAEHGTGWLCCCCAQVISLTREDVRAVCKVSSELAALQSEQAEKGSSAWRLSVQGHIDMRRGPELPAGAEPLGCEHGRVPEINHRSAFATLCHDKTDSDREEICLSKEEPRSAGDRALLMQQSCCSILGAQSWGEV